MQVSPFLFFSSSWFVVLVITLESFICCIVLCCVEYEDPCTFLLVGIGIHVRPSPFLLGIYLNKRRHLLHLYERGGRSKSSSAIQLVRSLPLPATAYHTDTAYNLTYCSPINKRPLYTRRVAAFFFLVEHSIRWDKVTTPALWIKAAGKHQSVVVDPVTCRII